MKSFLSWVLILYVMALHTSMAAMELFSTTLVLVTLVRVIATRDFSLLKQNRTLNFWLIGIVLAVFLSLVSTPQEKPFLQQFGYMRWTLVLWAIALSLEQVWNDEFIKRMIPVWLFTLGVVGLYGIFQCLTGIDFIHTDDKLADAGGVFRSVGFFALSLTFAYVMGMSTLAVSLTALKKWNIKIVALVLTLGGLGMVAAMSRGAWLAFIICVMGYLVINNRKLVIPAGAVFGLLILALNKLSSGFSSKIMGMAQLHVDHSESMRFDLWRGYWHMFLDHPLFGIGLLDGDKLLPTYYEKLGIVQPFVSHAHNNYLQWLAGSGIFGFTCYMAIIGIFLMKTWRLTKSEPAWGWSLLMAQLFLHIGGLTEANFIAAITNHFTMFVWALVLVLESKKISQMSKQ